MYGRYPATPSKFGTLSKRYKIEICNLRGFIKDILGCLDNYYINQIFNVNSKNGMNLEKLDLIQNCCLEICLSNGRNRKSLFRSYQKLFKKCQLAFYFGSGGSNRSQK